MSLDIIAILCVFDVVFAIAVIIWNMLGKNKSVNSTEKVINGSKKEELEQAGQDIQVNVADDTVLDTSEVIDDTEEVVIQPTTVDETEDYIEIDDSFFEDIKVRLENLENKIEETKALVREKEVVIQKIENSKEVVDNSKYDEIISRLNKIEQLIGERGVEYVKVEKQAVPVIKEVKEAQQETIKEIEDEDERSEIIRLTFAEKLLKLDEKVQQFYNTICNCFVSYRNVNRRVSNAGVSFRLGRELVAKLTIRGKTMKLHLALNLADFDEALYFQKDYSDVKAYQEVPFTVKVKSERATKRALELIGALATKKGIEEKTRYNEIDALKEIRTKV